MMLILNRAEKDLAYHSENVDSGDHDRAASKDSEHAVEHIGMFKRTDEDRHLGNEARQTG